MIQLFGLMMVDITMLILLASLSEDIAFSTSIIEVVIILLYCEFNFEKLKDFNLLISRSILLV